MVCDPSCGAQALGLQRGAGDTFSELDLFRKEEDTDGIRALLEPALG